MAYIPKKQNIETVTGTELTIENVAQFNSVKLLGNLNQEGTPTPSVPIDIDVVTNTQNISINDKVYNVDLGDIELCKIGDYQDYIYKSDNKWYLHKEIGKIDLTGTTGWWASGTHTIKNSSANLGLTNVKSNYDQIYTLAKCNYFEPKDASQLYSGDVSVGFGIYSDKAFYFSNNDWTLEQFNTFISENQVVVYYLYDNSVDTEITDIFLLNQLNSITLNIGTNIIFDTGEEFPMLLEFDYYEINNDYYEIIYSGESEHRIRIWFDNVELEDADRYCESFTIKRRILPDDGNKRFSLDNFISQEAELVLHNIDETIIKDKVRISIGTVIDSNSLGNIYEDIPLGIFNIQDTPTTDKDKTTIKLRDNAVLFDFGYSDEELLNTYNNEVTYMQILEDICEQAGVTFKINQFDGMNLTTGFGDSKITGRVYISYIAEQCGCMATINREGELVFIDLKNLYKHKIPLTVVEKYELGEKYKIGKVVFEDGILRFPAPNDEATYEGDILYLNGGNYFIANQGQVDNILLKLVDFEIDSVKTGKMLGDPTVDAYDLIEVYGYYEEDEDGNLIFVDDDETIVFNTLATHSFKYNGVMTSEYDTQIGAGEKTQNVTLTGEPTYQRYVKTIYDQIENTLTQLAVKQKEKYEELSEGIRDAQSYKNIFQITGGSNLIRNSQFLLTDDVWDITYTPSLDGYVTPLGEGYNSNLIGQTISVANIIIKNATISTKTENITGLKIGQQYTLRFYYSLDANTTGTVTMTSNSGQQTVINETYLEEKEMEEVVVSFVAVSDSYTLTFSSGTAGTGEFIIYDLMLNSGDVKNWEASESEIYSTVLTMSKEGFKIYARGSSTINLITSMGFKIYKSNNGEVGEIITDFTNTGIETLNLSASQSISNGIWKERNVTIYGNLNHIEYIEED